MDYLNKYNCKKKKYLKYSRGFTLIEMLTVLAIFAIIFAVSDTAYNNFRTHNNLKIATDTVVEALRSAQLNSEVGKGDSKWGVEILSNQIVIFKGINYVSRDVISDQVIDFPKGVTASGSNEFIFEKMTGSIIGTGTATLSNGWETKNISINEKGTITY